MTWPAPSEYPQKSLTGTSEIIRWSSVADAYVDPTRQESADGQVSRIFLLASPIFDDVTAVSSPSYSEGTVIISQARVKAAAQGCWRSARYLQADSVHSTLLLQRWTHILSTPRPLNHSHYVSRRAWNVGIVPPRMLSWKSPNIPCILPFHFHFTFTHTLLLCFHCYTFRYISVQCEVIVWNVNCTTE